MRTIWSAISTAAAERPERPALIHISAGRASVLGWAELQRLVALLSVQLGALAQEGGVVIMTKHHLLQRPLHLAAMAAGLTPSILAFPTPKQESERYWRAQRDLIGAIRPRIIIAYSEIYATMTPIADDVGALLVSIEDFAIHGEAAPLAVRPRRADAPALLQHSSGTTGARKGVALTFNQVAAQVEIYGPAVNLAQSSTVVSWLPLYHDMGLFTSYLIPFWVGAAVVALDPFEWAAKPSILLDALEAYGGTHAWLPNFAFGHLCNTLDEEAEYDLAHVRAIVSCSEAPKPRTMARFLETFARHGIRAEQLSASYAMAEATFAVTQSRIGQPFAVRAYDREMLLQRRAVRRPMDDPGAQAFVSNGTVVPQTDVRVLSEAAADDDDRAEGVAVGEIAVRGAALFSGYADNEEATARAFDGDWYRTGDIGFIDEGEVFVSGRVKDVIIVHGRNFFAHDIEEIVSTIKGVAPGRVVAVAERGEESDSEDVAIFFETAETGPEAEKRLRREIKRALFEALDLTPNKLVPLARGSLVKTTSGKVVRFGQERREPARKEEPVR